MQAIHAGSDSFSIPFDRQQLADYLGVDRSALSAELGRMRREGLLDFRKNWFHLRRARVTKTRTTRSIYTHIENSAMQVVEEKLKVLSL